MTAYLLRRILWMLPMMLGITLLVFCAVHVAPGDPVTVMLGLEAEGDTGEAGNAQELAERRRALERRYGLDRSLPVQYLDFLGPFNLSEDGHVWFGGSGQDPWGGVLLLDFERELHRPSVHVGAELGRRLRVSLPLALASILLSLLLAIPLGVFSAARPRGLADRMQSGGLFALYAVPTFWGGLMLILLFGKSGLGWLPVIGIRDPDVSGGLWPRAFDVLKHAVLPLVTLSYANLAYLSRQMRAGMLESLSGGFVRTARAMGHTERAVITRHALPHALLPLVTVLGDLLPMLVGGTVIVESLFDLPGMGRYAFEGLLKRDLNIIMATTTLSAFVTLLGTLLADLAYARLDPRIRYG